MSGSASLTDAGSYPRERGGIRNRLSRLFLGQTDLMVAADDALDCHMVR